VGALINQYQIKYRGSDVSDAAVAPIKMMFLNRRNSEELQESKYDDMKHTPYQIAQTGISDLAQLVIQKHL